MHSLSNLNWLSSADPVGKAWLSGQASQRVQKVNKLGLSLPQGWAVSEFWSPPEHVAACLLTFKSN